MTEIGDHKRGEKQQTYGTGEKWTKNEETEEREKRNVGRKHGGPKSRGGRRRK